jgi:hypothetical protein
VIGNIFIGTRRKDRTYIEPVIDGLSNHDAKLLVIKKYRTNCKLSVTRNKLRLINSDTAKAFTTHLSNVNWE